MVFSRSFLMALLAMLSNSPEVSDIVVVAHSMGGKGRRTTLSQLRSEGKNQVIGGPRRSAAPDIDAQMFRRPSTAHRSTQATFAGSSFQG